MTPDPCPHLTPPGHTSNRPEFNDALVEIWEEFLQSNVFKIDAE